MEIPDTYGHLYIEGELVRGRGPTRQVESPPLLPGKTYPLHLRAAFKVGDNLLIEDQQVLLHGASIGVTFDGSKAVSVPLPRSDVELIPLPKSK